MKNQLKMKSIKNKVEDCEHPIIKRIGDKLEGEPEGSTVGTCYYCKGTLIISSKYREVIGGVYELK